MPPNLRVVEASACVNAWNSSAIWAGLMPMPVSETRSQIPLCILRDFARHVQRNRAGFGEFGGIRQQVEQALPQLRDVGAHRAGIGGALHL